jgi:3-oxoadipate enol-lactonase
MGKTGGEFPVKDGHLFFQTAGQGDTVVFLHGFGLDSRMWAPQVDALKSSYRVIWYDLRGFGRSSLPPASSYAHEDDLNELLGYVGASPAHVVGLSMGGRMALRFAAAYPQSVLSLVLADSALDGHSWSTDWFTRWSELCEAARAGALSESRRRWLEHPLFDSARKNPASASLLKRMVEDYSCWHWRNRDSARTPAPPLASRLGDIRVPALVITGSRDIADFQAIGQTLASGLTNAQHVVIKDAGHMVNLEAAEEFNAQLLRFWRGFPGNAL